MRQLIVHIPITYVVLMGYLVKGQMGTISSSVMWRITSNIGVVYLRSILMLQREILLRIHLKNISTISLIGNFMGVVGVIGDDLMFLIQV